MQNLDPIIIDNTTVTPDISLLTTNSLDGLGVFDKLMKAVNLHLLKEFDDGRITGDQYSQVYLGALGAVLSQSVTYLLNQDTAKQIQADIGLIRQKTVTELANTDDDIAEGLGFNGTTAVEGLVASQQLINAQQLLLVTSQVATQDTEKDLTGQKVITELAATDANITIARAEGHGFNTTDTIAGALIGAENKSLSEAKLMEQKVVTELGQTSIVKPIDLGEISSTDISGIVRTQYDLGVSQTAKADTEVILLAQKTITELAQTSDTVVTDTSALNTTSVVTGMIDDQKNLYVAQKDGFLRDAEQKLLRIVMDSFIVGASNGIREANATNRLEDSDLGALVSKAASGIDVVI